MGMMQVRYEQTLSFFGHLFLQSKFPMSEFKT